MHNCFELMLNGGGRNVVVNVFMNDLGKVFRVRQGMNLDFRMTRVKDAISE